MRPDHPLHNLVCQCFENNPEKRPSADELVETLRQFCNSKISGGTKGAVTLGNFSCNLSRNFVATQVARCDTGCLNGVTLGNVSLLFWKLS